MADILVTSPYRPFALPSQFKAVFNGFIYCGTVDSVDPSVSQVQAYKVNEDGSRIPVAQPLRTNAGGYLVYNGQPAKFVTDSSHSLLVRDSIGAQLWYAPDVSIVDPDTAYQIIGTQAREALRRSHAESGRNLVDGSFEASGTLVNANDVLLQESTGKAFSGPAGHVAAGTDPVSGGFVDVSEVLLKLGSVGNVDSYINSPWYVSISAAIQACIDENFTVNFSKKDYQITSSLTPRFSGQQFLGNWCRLVAQGGVKIWDITLAFRESCKWSRIGHASSVAGTGAGMYSAPNIYLPTGVVEECSFEASLRYCVNANIILMKFRDCDFGTYGTAGALHQHIVTNGQNLSSSANLTTNLNAFQNCRFRKAKGTQYASEISDGFMYGFEMCDVEMNESTVAPFRFKGVLGVYFSDHCWFERNKSTYLASFGMDSTGALQGCQIVNVDNCWLSLDDESTQAFHSDTTNFAMTIDHCAGTGFAAEDGRPAKQILSVISSIDPPAYMRSFFHNFFVGYAPGYNQDQLYAPFMVNPVSPNYIAKATSPQYTLQNAAGAEQGKIIGFGDNTTGAVILETASGSATIRNKAAANTVQFVRGANGTEIRGFSKDGTQYKLNPPNGGGAAIWTGV